MDVQIEGYMVRQTDGQINGHMDRWLDVWTGWMGRFNE